MTTVDMITGFRRRRGVTGIEYGILAFLIAIAILVGVAFAGQQAKRTYCTVAGAIGAAPGCGGAGEASSTSAAPATFAGFPAMPAGTTCSYQASQAPSLTPPGGTGGMSIMSQSGVSSTCTQSDGASFSTAQLTQLYFMNTTTGQLETLIYGKVTSASGSTATVYQKYTGAPGQASDQAMPSSAYSQPVGATCSMETLDKLSRQQQQETGVVNPASQYADTALPAQVCSN